MSYITTLKQASTIKAKQPTPKTSNAEHPILKRQNYDTVD